MATMLEVSCSGPWLTILSGVLDTQLGLVCIDGNQMVLKNVNSGKEVRS